mmetsp:Transcript_6116/g.15125  ORF Transcript_6116/g.15125 Transcript_6116/m.15125 type:complete len:221 (+) Transcript_6116:3970-4632(+)
MRTRMISVSTRQERAARAVTILLRLRTPGWRARPGNSRQSECGRRTEMRRQEQLALLRRREWDLLRSSKHKQSEAPRPRHPAAISSSSAPRALPDSCNLRQAIAVRQVVQVPSTTMARTTAALNPRSKWGPPARPPIPRCPRRKHQPRRARSRCPALAREQHLQILMLEALQAGQETVQRHGPTCLRQAAPDATGLFATARMGTEMPFLLQMAGPQQPGA